MRARARSTRAWADRAPPAVLAVVAGLWALVFWRLAVLRHDRFATFGFDLGIYDQAAWLVTSGRNPFMTVRGIDVFGHHASFGLYLLAPGYWLGGGTRVLLAAQLTSQVAGAAALYLLARDTIESRWARWAGTGLAVVYLLHPTSGWLVWEYFHPDAFAIGPLLVAYWAARTRRWPLFWINAIVALSSKEDAALALALLGVVLVFRKERRRGALLAVAATGYYLFVTKLLLPARSVVGAFYEQNFFPPELGSSTFEIAANLLRRPRTTWRLVSAPDDRRYYWAMLAPVALIVPFAAAEVLAVGVPMVVVNVISVNDFTRNYRYHYSSLPLVAIMAATVEAVARIARRVRRAGRSPDVAVVALVGVLLATAVGGWYRYGIGPGAQQYDDGYWPLRPGESVLDVLAGIDPAADPRTAAWRAALARVPEDAAVTATYNVVAHLTHRVAVYEWPNPWIPVNWGARNENQRDPATVEYLVVDRGVLGVAGARTRDQQTEADLLGRLLRREFRVVAQRANLLVARRVAPPACFAASPQLAARLGTSYRSVAAARIPRVCPTG